MATSPSSESLNRFSFAGATLVGHSNSRGSPKDPATPDPERGLSTFSAILLIGYTWLFGLIGYRSGIKLFIVAPAKLSWVLDPSLARSAMVSFSLSLVVGYGKSDNGSSLGLVFAELVSFGDSGTSRAFSR